MTCSVLTPDQTAEAAYALRHRIDDLRRQLTRASKDPEEALKVATWLRHAENAYRALGGSTYRYLPAVARDPRCARK